MAKHAIAIVKKDPVISGFFKELDETFKRINERQEFLSKQMLKVQEDAEEQKKPIWAKIEAHCKEQNMLPKDYTGEKYHLHFDDEAGLLFCCDGDHSGPGGIMDKLKELFEK